MVGIAGLALAGSLGLLPDLIGPHRAAGTGPQLPPASAAGLTAPGGAASPSLPLTGGPTLTPTPTPTASPTPGGTR